MFSVSTQNALGYHCDKGLLSSLVSWIVAGNVTPSFVEGDANSSQVSGTMVLYEQSCDKQYVKIFLLLLQVFVDFSLPSSCPCVRQFSCNKILI